MFEQALILYSFISSLLLLVSGLYLITCYYRNPIFQILSLFLVLGGLKIGSHALILSPDIIPYEWFLRINAVTPLLFAPLIYLFVKAMASEEQFSWKGATGHFVPACLYLMYHCVLFLSGEYYLIPESIEKAIANGFTFLPAIGYTVCAFLILIKREHALQQIHSSSHQISQYWLKMILIIQTSVWTCAILVYLVAGSGLSLGVHMDSIILSVGSLWLYMVIVLRIKQPQIFVNEKVVPVASTSESKYEKSALPESVLEELNQKLAHSMEEEQLFLIPRLSLDELAAKVDCSKHELSQLINRVHGKNFYEYVNSFRIEYAKDLLLSSSDNLTINQIALESGFNSKSSFNTLFKKSEAATPTEFRNKKR